MDAKSIILLIVASGCIGVLIGLIPMHFAEQEKKAKKEIELIRCKDCKWFGNIGCAIQIVDDSDKPKETDYCSFGERK